MALRTLAVMGIAFILSGCLELLQGLSLMLPNRSQKLTAQNVVTGQVYEGEIEHITNSLKFTLTMSAQDDTEEFYAGSGMLYTGAYLGMGTLAKLSQVNGDAEIVVRFFFEGEGDLKDAVIGFGGDNHGGKWTFVLSDTISFETVPGHFNMTYLNEVAPKLTLHCNSEDDLEYRQYDRQGRETQSKCPLMIKVSPNTCLLQDGGSGCRLYAFR